MHKIDLDLNNTYEIDISGYLYEGRKMGFGSQLELSRIDAKMRNSADLSPDQLSDLIESLYMTFFKDFKPKNDTTPPIRELLDQLSMDNITKLIEYITKEINGAKDGQATTGITEASSTNS